MITEVLQRFFFENTSKLKPGSRVLVACSGGTDSVVLVHALVSLASELSFVVHVGHVNHALRGAASEGDARWVRGFAKKMKLPFHEERRPIKPLARGNLEETAREERYKALVGIARRTGCRAVFTAHTLDDQAETVLMNILRGTGPVGMGGMRPLRPMAESSAVLLCRPFLGIPKRDILDYLNVHRLGHRMDRTNKDPKFLRNWVRRAVVPLLESRVEGFKSRLGKLADLFREEEAHWQTEIERAQADVLRSWRRGRLLDLKRRLRYSPALQRRLLRQVMGKDLLTFDGVEGLRRWMNGPPTSGRIWTLRKGWTVERLVKSKNSPSTKLFWLRKKSSHEKV